MMINLTIAMAGKLAGPEMFPCEQASTMSAVYGLTFRVNCLPSIFPFHVLDAVFLPDAAAFLN